MSPIRHSGATTLNSSSNTEAPLQPDLSDLTAQVNSAAKDAVDAAASLGDDLKAAARTAARAAKAQAGEFASDLGHEFSKTAEEQKQRGVEGMQTFARAINSAAAELEGHSPQVAQYIRDAAHKVEGFSGNINGRNVNELLQAACSVARTQPALFIGGAVAAGFALSRFLKSSAPSPAAQTQSPGHKPDGAQRQGGSDGYQGV
jgi:ABC-type transporter Mla subunit MlaD